MLGFLLSVYFQLPYLENFQKIEDEDLRGFSLLINEILVQILDIRNLINSENEEREKQKKETDPDYDLLSFDNSSEYSEWIT